jgi:hypothetical protein
MKMEMIHGLAAIFAGIDDYTVARAETFIPGDSGSRAEEMAEQFAMHCAGAVERGNMFAGNDENVNG